MISSASSIEWASSKFASKIILKSNGDVNLCPSLYLASLRLDGKSVNSITNYAHRLDVFFEVLSESGQLDWRKLDDETMSIYINRYLIEHRGISDKSLAGHITVLSGFYEWAWRNGYLKHPPSFSFHIIEEGIPRRIGTHRRNDVPSYINKYINHKKYDELLASITTDNAYLLERNEIILDLGYHMGLRSGEVTDPCNLRVSELKSIFNDKSSKRTVSILGKGEKIRRVPIPPALLSKIKNFLYGRHLKTKSDYLICSELGKPLNRQRPNSLFRDSTLQTLDSFWDTRSFHSLRHTFATNLVAWCYENKLDPWQLVPEYLGHSRTSTTFGYIVFEALMENRHSLLKKLRVEQSQIDNYQHRFQ